MPYATHQDVHIHYDVTGHGPDLVLLHGFGMSGADWSDYGYVQALAANYHVIALDMRGHGQSDKPHHTAAYALERRVEDVVAVLDALQVRQAHCWGYSLGGWLALGVAALAPHRLRSLILGGTTPYVARSVANDPDPILAILTSGADQWTAWWEQIDILPSMAGRLQQADTEALLAMKTWEAAWDGYDTLLPTIKVPCLLYAGAADGVGSGARRAAETIPEAVFLELPGLTHFGAWKEVETILPHVRRFLNRHEVR